MVLTSLRALFILDHSLERIVEVVSLFFVTPALEFFLKTSQHGKQLHFRKAQDVSLHMVCHGQCTVHSGMMVLSLFMPSSLS